ncbi:MAG: ATP-binding protein [bacterium]
MTSMRTRLSVLLVEDNIDDALMLERELGRGDYDVVVERVDSEQGMIDALDRVPWDAIVADYTLPAFGAVAALELVKDRRLDIPFIIVSGVIDDDAVVASLKAGANDFMTKRKLSRLLPALEREVREARVRRSHRLAEAALRESDERYRIVVEHATDVILITNEGGTILYANPVTQEIFGLAPSVVIGRSLTTIVRVPLQPMSDSALAAYIRQHTGDARTRVDLIGAHESGAPLQFEASIGVGTQEGASVFICVLRDVTERRAAEIHRANLLRATEDARRQAENANRVKSEFLSMVSHELRTPLTAIIGHVELLADGVVGPVSDEQVQHLDRVSSNSNRLLALINEVLTFSTIEATTAFELVDVPMQTLLATCMATTRKLAEDKRLAVSFTSCEPGVSAWADAGRLQQALSNVLDNAVKFTAAGGTIDVTCDADDRAIRIRVRDTGVGMLPQKLDTIFDPFVQLDTGLTRAHGGMGLGLAISRRFIRGMGGGLHVESTHGVGSVVTISVPRAPMSKPLRVLIVEDLEMDEALLIRALTRAGYAVSHERVQTGREMETALETGTWDIVISDYVMPLFSGTDALALVRERAPAVPFIMLSGTIARDLADDAIRAGAFACVMKSNMDLIAPTVERALGTTTQ